MKNNDYLVKIWFNNNGILYHFIDEKSIKKVIVIGHFDMSIDDKKRRR